jgi:eukaryotic-like serine/threonine-protein kinase
MGIFDKKAEQLPGPAPESGKEDIPSGVVDRSSLPLAKGPPRPAPPSGARPRVPASSGMTLPRPSFASTPTVEMGDPTTYDPTIEDSSERVPAITAGHEDLLAEPRDEEAEAEEPADGPDPHVGTTLGGRYVLEEVIGEGGMGRVYRCHHKIIGKRLAVKILHAELARDKEAVGRFVREAQAASSIGNPHIVDIADFGEVEDGSTYFVMEYLDGDTLADWIESKAPLSTELVLDIALQLADGLAAAHRQQIVHRDLKPDNITLVKHSTSDHFCKILDFGIAKVSTSTSSTKLTMAGAVFGTPHYMSPEQAAGAAVDHRTDIYSLGVILYEMAAGVLPFHADNFMGILTQHMYKAPAPIRPVAESCSAPLEALILKCLCKMPEGRYQTMEELTQDLRRVVAGEVPQAALDMAQRSGSFNLPADYFQAAQISAVMPLSAIEPPTRLRPAYVAMFAGIGAAVGLVLLVLLKNNLSDAQPAPEGLNAANAERPAAAPSVEAIEKVDVMLASNAQGAIAVVGGEQFALPKLIEVQKGEPLKVRVIAKGFVDQEVELDGSVREVKITQQAQAQRPAVAPKESATAVAPRPVPPRPRPTGTQPPKPKPADGVVDPWEK